MRTNAGLHADQTRRQISQTGFDLAARPLLPQHNGATSIQTDDVERVLANIDADDGDRIAESLRHGVLLVWLPLASLPLGGEGARPDHPISGHIMDGSGCCRAWPRKMQ